MPGSAALRRIFECGDTVRLKLFEASGSVFGVCPIKLEADSSKPRSSLEYFVQGVKDSSRYFVIRCEDEGTGKHAYIGVGLRDRDVAFNLRATLQDQLRSVARQRSAPSAAEEAAADASASAGLAEVQCGAAQLQTGQSMKLSINMGGKRSRKQKAKEAEAAAAVLAAVPDDDWGDFQC